MKIWEFIEQHLPCCLMVVVDHSTGSPGRQGFKMAVAADGSSCGTIGGGPMELRLIKQAQDLISSPETGACLVDQVHDNAAPANRSGMICSGAQTVALCPLREAPAPNGRLRLTQSGLTFVPTDDSVHQHFVRGEAWSYEENLQLENVLHIVGGGHVGLALSRCMAPLDFRVRLFDHRPEVHTLEQNSYADEIVVTPMEYLARHIQEGGRRYGVIVSTNFKTDEIALKQLIGLNLDYLGIMGSPAKLAHLFDILRAEGYSDDAIERVHAPIGLPINSHSPAEIAVSIAAELISVKNS